MTNPLLTESTLPYQLPPFGLIEDSHYLPAFELGCEQQLAEVDAITQTEGVTFENTVVALERTGALLTRVLQVFFNKTSSDTNPTLQALEGEIAPALAAHEAKIRLNPGLYIRLETLEKLEQGGSLELDPESSWLLRRYLLDFRFAGAALAPEQRKRVAEINERTAFLSAEFDRLLLADTNDLALELEDDSRLAGLTDGDKAALQAAATERGKTGYLIAMMNFSGHPLLEKLEDRELRAEILQRTLSRGSRGNEYDTSAVITELLTLRQEKAALFGYRNFAEYATALQTAKSPERIHEVLRKIAPLARRNAEQESLVLAELARAEGVSDALRASDWSRYAEQERVAKYQVDTSALRPYFELGRVLEHGVFYAANRLYGLSFKARPDLVGYHPDASVYEVFFEDGSACGLYIFDPFTRASKHGGAWMNNLVDQSRLLGLKPVVVNNLNVTKPAAGDPALLTFDEVNTLFHEFGHTLHGLLSDVNYPRFSGTSVERDFVEFPSQVNEMWMLWPEVLSNYALHHETGEPLSAEIATQLAAAEAFNQGFETTHYLAAAILDLALHEQNPAPTDLEQFEADAIAAYGLDHPAVPVRYRTNYFAHIFGGGYAAGYYGYIWSEILDADTVDWFKANGGLTRANGEHFSRELLSRGGSVDSLELYRNFRGRDASIEPLMKRRGLV
jgi:peptidyl-dipeptidase Dcp